jgi:branched-chain amino acid transport system substrate-binding protein
VRSTLRNLSIATAAVLTLASCGSSGEDGGNSEALQGSGTGDSCKIDGPVPVGAAFSITGAGAGYGEFQKNGVELAAEELNQKEGITYELTVEDDQTDPRQAISVFEEFVNDDVSVIIGPTLSTNALQAQPIAQDAGVPVLAVSNTAAGITEQGEYIFRDSLTEAQVIPQTVAKSHEKLGYEKVVVMYANDDALAESGYDAFAGALEDEGVQVLDTLTFSKADTDLRSLLTEAKNAQPDALVVSSLIEAAIPLVTQAREIGIEVPIIGGNGFNTPQLAADAGEAAEGVIVGAAWNASGDSPENQAFLEAYEAKYGESPDQFAAQAYTGLMLIDEAIRANCSAAHDDIRDGLAGLQDIPTVLGDFSIQDSRDAEHPAVVQVIEDGTFQVLD